MIDFTDTLLNECGDVEVENGDTVLISGVDRIRQSWLIHIRTFLGEWFLNLDIGVPYIQTIFSKKVTKDEVGRVFATASLEVPGIERVNNVDVGDVDLVTRVIEVTVDAVCEGEEGSVTFKYKGELPLGSCSEIGASDYPLTIGDMRIWFDAQDLSNLNYDLPSGVLALANKAGTGEAVGAGSGLNIPALLGTSALNGKRAIHFDNASGGSNDEYLRFTNTQAIRGVLGELTLCVVLKPEDPGGDPHTRGVTDFSGFDAVTYNREGCGAYIKTPNGNSGTVFKASDVPTVTDGSMEKSGTADWTAENDAILTKETTTPYRGVQCLRVAYGGLSNPRAKQTTLTANKFYRLTGVARGDGTTYPSIQWGSGVWNGTTSSSWQSFDLVIRPSTTALYLYGIGSSGYADFDNLRVVELLMDDGNSESITTAAWTAGNSASLSKSTTSPYAGSRCLQVAYTSVADPYAYQTPMSVGYQYRLRGAAYSDGVTVPTVKVGTTTLWTGTASVGWETFDVMFNATSTELRFVAVGASGFAWFDEIELDEIGFDYVTPSGFFDPVVLTLMHSSSGTVAFFRDGVYAGSSLNIGSSELDGDGVIGALLDPADFLTAESFFHGYIGEVLAYASVLDSEDLANLHNFLLSKWNF